ncbi:MAG TPA: glucoamylase family protein, partial [Anaerolineaceae bacterium]
QNLPAAAPLLLAWLLAPLAAYLINRSGRTAVQRLSEAEEQTLRNYARRTWSFYEQFVGPEDHWLPPDHYQESPLGLVAHRTSPTNIGMLLTSTLGAYELGYIDQYTLISRLSATFETLTEMERYRGHFINWIDTRTLQPLTPRYVSTVDSGNLAACLVLVSQSMHALGRAHIFRWQRWQGYLDMLAHLEETVRSTEAALSSRAVDEFSQLVADIRERVLAVRTRTGEWYGLFEQVRGPLWQKITEQLSALVASLEGTPSAGSLQRILQISRQIDQQLTSIERTVNELVAWIPLLECPPPQLEGEKYAAEMARLRAALPYSPAISEIRQQTGEALSVINDLRERMPQDAGGQMARAWLDALEKSMAHAGEQSSILHASYTRLARQSEQFISEMDFRFLYDPERHVFHIGYNMDAARLDDNYYDLLASEARITSLIAIAKGDVPVEHWLHLNRPVTRLGSQRVLLSWSATLFEYLMPALFLRTYEGTLLHESAQGAVRWQIEYGRSQGVPWGISESGYYHFDANRNYQYRAFGVPGLGFKRGLADDLVIAPYASLMAVGFAPGAVMENAAALEKLGGLGQYGFYEALDFTQKRIPLGEKAGIVRSYMAHHQGMILLGIVNYLNNQVMLDRMHADPQIRSVELLLQEQVPLAAPLQNPESENVSGTQRLVPPLVSVTPWVVPTQTSIPQVHLLANENFTSLVSNSGSGFVRWKDTDLTRWSADEALDNLGHWLYLQELDAELRPGRLWSISKQPVSTAGPEPVVVYHAHMAVYRREENDVIATLEVTVSPEDPVEVRRVHLHNARPHARRLRLTSYGEVILAAQTADARHPAFNKLFIQSEFVESLNLLIFRRRPRSSSETPPFLGHMLVTASGEALNGGFETDRMHFLGRGNDPSRPGSLLSEQRAAGSVGSTLDPVFSLGQEVELEPHSNSLLAWVTFAAGSREELLALAARYADWRQVERTFQQAHAATENRLRRAEIGASTVEQFSQVLSGLLYPMQQMRAAPEIIAANRLGQSGLWPFGISGDYPILLVEIEDSQRLELVREALRAQRFYRERGILVDLVILNAQRSNYGAEMNRLLYRLISRTGSDTWINQRGGVFVIYADQMKPAERSLLRSAARVVLNAERGELAQQLPGYSVAVPHLPAFMPSRVASEEEEPTPPLPAREDLLFWNGRGGFTPDGREYVIELDGAEQTPLPWSNVIGYPEFGFLVTEAGSSTTWAGNSGENRLTPWSNDPVSDPSGEALYLRDEETGAVWSPTPGLLRAGGTFRVRHGAGYTIFEHHAQGLRHRLRLFADPRSPVKIIQLRVENTWRRPRRITATQYAEWVLGTLRSATRQYIIPEYDDEHAALLATNPYSAEFGERVAFLAASKRVHGMTADRVEFLGRNGSPRTPAGLSRIGLEGR